jgi:hypothetical protein
MKGHDVRRSNKILCRSDELRYVYDELLAMTEEHNWVKILMRNLCF